MSLVSAGGPGARVTPSWDAGTVMLSRLLGPHCQKLARNWIPMAGTTGLVWATDWG